MHVESSPPESSPPDVMPPDDAPAQVSEPPIETSEPASSRTRSPLVASALSFLFPGAGQMYLGRRLSALAFALPALAVVVWTVSQLSHGLAYFGASLLDETYALTVMVVASAVTLWRVASIAHPFVISRPGRIGARAAAAFVALIVATLAMGYPVVSNAYDFYAASRQIAANDLADATASPGPSAPPSSTPPVDQSESPTPIDLGSEEPSDSPSPTPSPGFTCPPSYSIATTGRLAALDEPAPVPALDAPLPADEISPDATGSSTPTSEPTTSPSPSESATSSESSGPSESPSESASPQESPAESPTGDPGSSPSAGPSPSRSASPSPSPSPTWQANPRRLTIVLIGTDFIAGRNHALTDTLMLVSVNLDTRAVAMVSVPRDTAGFPLYFGGAVTAKSKINALAKAVSSGSLKSPDSPMMTVANEVGYLVGVKPNYYAAIDMGGFISLVDLVGGVDVNNPRVLNDPFTCTYVPTGKVHFDGAQALRYVRSRESTNDYYRAGRQQIVMMALRQKLATPAILPKLGSLLSVASKSIATNFPLNTVKDYVDTAEHVTSISHCVLGPPYNWSPSPSSTGGAYTTRLKLDRVANLSVYLFGADSRYYGQAGVSPSGCQNSY
jgi:LCP family protein required for cell wall assembly